MNDPSPPAPWPLLFPSTVALPAAPPDLAGSVAVIMRTKDRPRLLERALASVAAQTHGAWHLYLVNDGGDPGVLDHTLGRHLPGLAGRLSVINLPHSLGMEAASNAGLARAREEFVAVHDDDDSWDPEFLAATTGFLTAPTQRHCVGVTTGCTLITERLDDSGVVELARLTWPHNRRLTSIADIL